MFSFFKSSSSHTSSDSSESDSKENTLLDTSFNSSVRSSGIPSSNINSGVIIHRHDSRRRVGFKNQQDTETEVPSCCGCMGQMTILFLPILAMIFNVALLALLADYDQSELQESEIYGGEDYQDLAKIYYASISADSISLVMSQYDPYRNVLALSSVSCVLVTMATVARNIQIEVYQKRVGSFVFMKFINYLAALINILSYAGLMVAVNFKATQEEPAYAAQAHLIGFLSFFAGTATYAVLHTFLLFNQDYPFMVKFLFYLLAVIIVSASLAFGIPIWEGGLDSDSYSDPVYEWVAVFASAISIGFYVILFFVDPCDEELGAFFCGVPNRQVKKFRDRRAKRRMKSDMGKTYSV